MSENNHHHKWQTRYVAIEGVDCASGMECKCDEVIPQDEVEELVQWASDYSKSVVKLMGLNPLPQIIKNFGCGISYGKR